MSTFQFAYYPGCSGLGTSTEYEQSTLAVCKMLDMELVEIPDWNCCGSTPAHAVDHVLSASLVARNLALADDMENVSAITTPCPSCLKNLKTSQHRMQDSTFREQVEEVVDRPVEAALPIKSVLQILIEDIGIERIKKSVTSPLKGLRVVPYYGCIMTRPPDVMQFGDAENPMAMDDILLALGAEVLPFALKTDCCGASLGIPRKEVVMRLSGRILDAAVLAGADAVVSACPLCQMNLDMRQGQINAANGTDHRIPVFYYTQLMGLAAGAPPDSMGLDKLCVNPRPVLAAMAEKQAQEEEEKAKKRAAQKAKEEAAA